MDKNELNENSLSFCFLNNYNYPLTRNYIYLHDYFYPYYNDSRLQNTKFNYVTAYQTTVLSALNIKINKK